MTENLEMWEGKPRHRSKTMNPVRSPRATKQLEYFSMEGVSMNLINFEISVKIGGSDIRKNIRYKILAKGKH